MRHTNPIIVRWIKRSAVWLTLVCLHPQLQGQSADTDFYGRVVDKNALCAQASGFMSEQDVERLIGEMLAMQGLKNRFIVVGCQSVTNCIATVDKSNRPVILFNPAFLQRVQKLQFSESDLPVIGERDWLTLTILAHEIGHHMNNHLTNPLPDATRRSMELEADETAGFLLYLMGGQLEQGKLAFREASVMGSYTHPPRVQRHEALTRGYTDAAKRFPRNRGGGGPDPIKPNPVPSSRVSFASVTIGSQVWMMENLNVELFRNNDPIPEAKSNAEWLRARDNKQPAWCYYDNDPSKGAIHGKLYNWYAVNDPRGLAPEGWHVPTDAEWTNLSDDLGGSKIAGTKVKSSSSWVIFQWDPGNGTNETRFSGLPSGYRYSFGTFLGRGTECGWWSSSKATSGEAWYWSLFRVADELFRATNSAGFGYSVRCVRD